jgi:hypothetical protein
VIGAEVGGKVVREAADVAPRQLLSSHRRAQLLAEGAYLKWGPSLRWILVRGEQPGGVGHWKGCSDGAPLHEVEADRASQLLNVDVDGFSDSSLAAEEDVELDSPSPSERHCATLSPSRVAFES